MSISLTALCVIALLGPTLAKHPFILNENTVCDVKATCLDCMRLPHCSWCKTESKCFSKKLPSFEDKCKENAIDYEDRGFSYEENALCACSGGDSKSSCYPPGVSAGAECSNHGKCVCGRCICDAVPDPDHPKWIKIFMGEHCEFDNFSCIGSKCNEGPYLSSQPRNDEETSGNNDIDTTK